MKTTEELINIARLHTKDLPRVSAQPWAMGEALPKVTMKETVIVSFGGDAHANRAMILLEKESGAFVASWLSPQQRA